jgi:N-acetylglucosamine-6-phosphate deacetylase
MVNDELNERERIGAQMDRALQVPPASFIIKNARKIDANGIVDHYWCAAVNGVIEASGTADTELEAYLRAHDCEVVEARGAILTPGFIDIHAHGAWAKAYDDGPDAILTARAGHMTHGTTRQVLSLITNPLEVMSCALREVHALMPSRPDILGTHLEGPFLALSRKGAHDPKCLIDPSPRAVDTLLEAADGSLRQITIAPELPGGMEAVRRLVDAGVVPAVGHTDADYSTAAAAFDAGSTLMTHVFNAMNGLHHRAPGPIPAALERQTVSVEFINDGFHVQDPMCGLVHELFGHRIVAVTDAMAATDCPDGAYKLGGLDVTVEEGHARLVSNGAIAGSTLTLDVWLRRAIQVLGFSPAEAVEAVTLAPARALGLNRENSITDAPLGVLAAGFAADFVLLDPGKLTVQSVWCAGRRMV